VIWEDGYRGRQMGDDAWSAGAYRSDSLQKLVRHAARAILLSTNLTSDSMLPRFGQPSHFNLEELSEHTRRSRHRRI
jgi:hypothetical protein